MTTISVRKSAGRCGTVLQEMAEMLRDGCGTVHFAMRDSFCQVLDFIAGRSGHFCGKVRVAVSSLPTEGNPAGLLEVGPAVLGGAGCSETTCHSGSGGGWLALLLLAGCSYHPAACTNVMTGEVRTGETQPGVGVGISGYIVRDRNGIEGTIDATNSNDWRCRVEGSSK